MTLAAEPALRPRVVQLEGPSGFGKSALLQELAPSHCGPRPKGAGPQRSLLPAREGAVPSARPLLNALCDALLHAPEELLEALGAHVTSHLLSLFPVLERIAAFARRQQQGALIADPA